MSKAYPLAWPTGWPRTEPTGREGGRFRVTLPQALSFLEGEVNRLQAKNLVISSNVTLGATTPKDPGVCAYFDYQELHAAIPCDRWTRVEANVNAIAKTIEAMRGIERWGAKNMIKAAFTGFAALPAPKSKAPWREVLQIDAERPSKVAIEAAYKELRSRYHPDKDPKNNDGTMFHAVRVAYDEAIRELEQ